MGSKITDFLRNLVAPLGGEAADAGSAAAVEYNGYRIRPAPRKQGSQWLTAGVITKQFDDGVKEYPFIRAETHGARDAAEQFAIVKGKQIVDEFGDRMFKAG